MGIEGNERVDRLIADLGPPPDIFPSSFTHFSFEKCKITIDTIRDWNNLAFCPNPTTNIPEPDPTYWGHNFLHHDATHVFNPALASSIICRFGKLSITTFARINRLLTDHNFTGAYRAKFRPSADEPTECSCGFFPRGTKIQDRHHILYECLFYYRGDNNCPEHLLDMDPFPKILSFLSLNPGAFSIQDAPPDMSEWDDNDIDPRLDFLINQIGELALRHASVRARLPIPGYNNTTNTLPALAAVSAFKNTAHTRDFNVALLPFLELAHKFRQKTRHNHFVKTLQSRGHHYNLTYDKSFLVLH